VHGVLLTGATGLVGQALLPRLLALDAALTVWCLLRADDATALAQRRARLLADAAVPACDHDRVVAVAGDVKVPGLGLADVEGVAAHVDTVINTAASTRFDLALEAARSVNVASVEHIVEFARLAQRHGGFDRIHHVSTAYVAGDHAGVIDAPPLEPLGAFRNNYEQSKWEGEVVLREAGDTVPFTISRPSIIVGDSATGVTPHFRVLYEPMKWVYFNSVDGGESFSSRLTDVLPCRPDVRLDVVPVDFVADAIVALVARDEAIGDVFHVTAGPEHVVSIEQTVDVMLVAANELLAASGRPLIPRPQIVSPEMLEADEELREIFELAESVMSLYMPYGLCEQVFSADTTRAVLGGALRECPHPRDYYPTLVRYATETNYGRKPRRTSAD
jgi:thioester reductase-like protein